MKKKPHKYYDVLTSTENPSEATILMYGYIGEYYDSEKGWYQAGVKDIDFVQELERLAAKYPTIHVRINSPGGEIFHGSAIVTAIRNCPAEVHTWIDGVAASMAGVIWMAGKKRHMAKNGMLMIHSASGMCWGNAADMREIADNLDQFDRTLIISAADSTGMKEEDMKARYFDYRDHWLTWNDVNAEGWLAEEPDEYQTEAPLPENVEKMSYRALVEFYNRIEAEKENKPPAPDNLLGKLRAAWANTIAAVTGGTTNNHSLSQTDIEKMNLDEFKNSLTAGTLNLDEVKAHVATLDPAPAPAQEPAPAEPVAPATAPATDMAFTAALDELKKQVADLKASNADLLGKVTAYGQQPGAGKSVPGAPAQDLPTADGADTPEARYKALAAEQAAAAARNEPVSFTAG